MAAAAFDSVFTDVETALRYTLQYPGWKGSDKRLDRGLSTARYVLARRFVTDENFPEGSDLKDKLTELLVPTETEFTDGWITLQENRSIFRILRVLELHRCWVQTRELCEVLLLEYPHAENGLKRTLDEFDEAWVQLRASVVHRHVSVGYEVDANPWLTSRVIKMLAEMECFFTQLLDLAHDHTFELGPIAANMKAAITGANDRSNALRELVAAEYSSSLGGKDEDFEIE
jgi:hypothetical protein